MGHVVLFGDSIFDNASYVPGGPSVIEHLRRALPKGWEATLLAVDGAVASDVARQTTRLPEDATHVVVSAGGNDALGLSGYAMRKPAATIGEALERLGEALGEFRADYRAMLRGLVDLGRPVVACTIYDAIPRLSIADHTGLCLFNDVILREAFRNGVPVIDLRLICNEATDYAPVSPIEPSAAGGGKIARAVARAVAEPESAGSRVFA